MKEKFGDFSVQLLSTEEFESFVVKRLLFQYQEEKRTVWHYQYTAWPDHGIPSPAPMLQMMEAIDRVCFATYLQLIP